MHAPEPILQVWRQFGGLPMETFTKGWWYRTCGGAPRQRTIAELEAHRRELGAGGNCFDLALWLRHALREAGIGARCIGHDLCTAEAHLAVLAEGPGGAEYLCDLGDLWLQPILVASTCDRWYPDFFPGRDITLSRTEDELVVAYRRTNGRLGRQSYDLRPIPEEELPRACHHSQNLLRRPFCEMLLPHPETGRLEHWEYDRGASFWNLAGGLVLEAPCATLAEWGARVSSRTGLASELVMTAFAVYGQP